MEEKVTITLVKDDAQLQEVAKLAEQIWHQHFTPIIGEKQVNYMVEKFQSYPALKSQIADGYEYYAVCLDGKLVGYTGVHAEDGALFLSKLYLEKSARGKGISSQMLAFLEDLCRKQGLSKIWLTCNKYNENSLKVYRHWNFQTTDSVETDIGGGFIMDDYIMERSLAPHA